MNYKLNFSGLEIGRKNYEVYICKHSGNDPDDYETIDIESASSYSDAINIAKRVSILKEWNNEKIFETHVVCYTATEYTDYGILYHRVYLDGKFYCTMD